MHLEDGDVVINAPENSAENFYVKGLRLNEENWPHSFLNQEDLLKGAVLDFSMASKPNKRRGISREDRPAPTSTPKANSLPVRVPPCLTAPPRTSIRTSSSV